MEKETVNNSTLYHGCNHQTNQIGSLEVSKSHRHLLGEDSRGVLSSMYCVVLFCVCVCVCAFFVWEKALANFVF